MAVQTMDMRALKCFVWTAELGSITRASSELGIVQPALSRKIQNLEDEIGATLFTRLPRGIQLTAAGRQFLEHARRMLREFEHAKSELAAHPAHVEGDVTLGLSPSLAPIIAPGVLDHVRHFLPGIRLKVVEGFSVAMLDPLLSGRIDVAVLTNPPRLSALRLVPAVSEEVVVVTPPGTRGIRRFYTVEELCQAPLVVTSGFRAVVDEQLRKIGRQLRPSVEIDSVEAIRRLMLRGNDVTIMPVSTFNDDVRSGRLDAFHIADASLQRLLVIASPHSGGDTPAIQQVVSVIGELFSTLSEQGAFQLGEPAQAPAALKAPKRRAARGR